MARYFTERTVERRTSTIAVLALRTEQLRGTDAAGECRDELSQYEPTGSVVVNLGNALTIESSVIGGILALNKTVRRLGHKVCVCNAGEQVLRLLIATKLDMLLPVAGTEEEAFHILLGDVGG